jgi:hypothetical protein
MSTGPFGKGVAVWARIGAARAFVSDQVLVPFQSSALSRVPLPFVEPPATSTEPPPGAETSVAVWS